MEMVCPPPLNVVGFTEVVFKISHLFRAYQKVKEALRNRKPDLIILIDYPDMNLRLARAAHRENIPVLYYIGPQVWAWRSGRVRDIARYVNRLAVILPFEADFYKPFGVQAEFVGHPLMDRLRDVVSPERPMPRAKTDQTLIGLLPGSRPGEIKMILPILLETARGLTQEYGRAIRFVLPVANTLDPQTIQEHVRPYQESGLALELAYDDSQKALGRCHQAIVASGTVTLEAAILGIPFLIVYKVSTVNYWIARHLIDIPYVGLVNWVAGKKIIPEYIQTEAVPKAIMAGVRRYLEEPDYVQQIKEALSIVRDKLGHPGASERVAGMAVEMMS
jgi:lipid-A-disaccharide synthase